MKIAMVGCGALGSFYGAKLCRLGGDVQVHFLLRSDYEVVRAQGVQVHSVAGDFQARPHCARTPEEIGVCDLVLIGLKTTANAQFPALLPPLMGPRTMVVTLQNGLGNEERLAELFGAERIFGGLCFVCLNRIAPGVIRHQGHGKVVLGEFNRYPSARVEGIARLFNQAQIPCEITEDLARSHWEKLVWNVPFNGLGVAGTAGYDAVIRGELAPGQTCGPCLPTSVLLGEPRWYALVVELMLEVIACANARKFPVPAHVADENIERSRCMGAYYASTLLDYAAGLPLELESLFLEPLRLAQQTGYQPPRLAALCRILQQLDQRKQRVPIAVK